jgi:hypothetical protein
MAPCRRGAINTVMDNWPGEGYYTVDPLPVYFVRTFQISRYLFVQKSWRLTGMSERRTCIPTIKPGERSLCALGIFRANNHRSKIWRFQSKEKRRKSFGIIEFGLFFNHMSQPQRIRNHCDFKESKWSSLPWLVQGLIWLHPQEAERTWHTVKTRYNDMVFGPK